MSGKKHPFLDDLSDDVVLSTSITRAPVPGKEAVLKLVKAGAGLYLSQSPTFLGSMGERTYFEYEVTLAAGRTATGLVSILRDGGGQVTKLTITFSPLGSVLILAEGVRDQLAGEFDAEVFL